MNIRCSWWSVAFIQSARSETA